MRIAAREGVQADAVMAIGIYARPIGFYTWSDGLRAIWRQDRLLQSTLPPSSAWSRDGPRSC